MRMLILVRSEIAAAIWNTSEYIRIPLPYKAAPIIFGWMIGARPNKANQK